MSAPITKGQMAFDLPKLSYIDARWEEPELQSDVHSARGHGFAAWIAARVVAFRAWREQNQALAELNNMTDHELLDLGLNRGDFDRIFDARYNQDLIARGRDY